MERALFAVAAVAYLGPVVGGRLGRFAGPFTRPAWVWFGIALHVVGIGWACTASQFGSMRWGLAVLALLVVAGRMILSRRPRMAAVGGLLLPIAVLVLGASLVSPGGGEAQTSLWVPMHVALVFLGLASFAVSFSLSAVYLFERARLKERRLEGLMRLPALDTLDALNLRAMGFGFVTLTAGMGVVAVYSLTVPEADVRPDLTVYATLLVWAWYAAALHARLVGGWHGRRAAWFGVVGFAGLALLLVTAGLLFRGFHGFTG